MVYYYDVLYHMKKGIVWSDLTMPFFVIFVEVNPFS